MTNHVTATFKSRAATEAAVQKLIDAGFYQDDISVLVTDTTRGTSFAIKERTKSEEYTGTGATAGGAFGAIAGLLMAASIIPTAGASIVAVGPLFATLAGLGAGSFAGGVLGALVGAGVPEHEAKMYESSVKDGSILLAVAVENKDEKHVAEKVLKEADSIKVAA